MWGDSPKFFYQGACPSRCFHATDGSNYFTCMREWELQPHKWGFSNIFPEMCLYAVFMWQTRATAWRTKGMWFQILELRFRTVLPEYPPMFFMSTIKNRIISTECCCLYFWSSGPRFIPLCVSRGICKRALQEGRERGPCKRALQEGRVRGPCKRALQEGRVRGLCKRALQEGRVGGLWFRKCGVRTKFFFVTPSVHS
jgi:hypothetical protein